MSQNSCVSEELGLSLEEIKDHQRRGLLLCIDEILTTMDMANPAMGQWEAARSRIQLIEGNKFAALASIPIGSE